MLRTKDHYQKQSSGKNKEKIQTNDEWKGMNENSGKVITQTKIEVSESRMSAEVEICQTNDEWTGMNGNNSVDIAKHEEEVNDKAIRALSQESEGYREQGQTEQVLGSLGAETLPDSRVL